MANTKKDCTKVKCKCLYRDCINSPEWICPRCGRVYELTSEGYVIKMDI